MQPITIYVFEVNGPGNYVIVGARSREEALQSIHHADNAELVGTVPADELYLQTTTAPTILYQSEAMEVRTHFLTHNEFTL